MSDGYSCFDAQTNVGVAEADQGFWRDGMPETTLSPAPMPAIDLHRIAEAMPRLGTVLWLSRARRERAFPRARLAPQGVLLLEHPALAALADCATARARCAVTLHGPREWLEFRDVHNAAIAKLYLLPETDYMAWDAMLTGCDLPAAAVPQLGWHAHVAFMRGAFTRLGPAWQARIVRLPLLRLSCLNVLGLRAPEHTSALGRRLAGAIVEDEHAIWCEA